MVSGEATQGGKTSRARETDMRKIFGCFLMVSVVVAGFGGSPVKAKKKDARRVVVSHYNGPAIGTPSTYYACVPSFGCVDFSPYRGERSVSFDIQDAAGLPVYAQVGQWVLAEPNNYIADKDMMSFCGKTTRPFRIDPKKGDLVVYIWGASGPVPDCPGVATFGDVTATFTKK